MLESIEFKNFKALRDTVLPLQPLTLIVGPNGSGKSTALQGLWLAGHVGDAHYADVASRPMTVGESAPHAELTIRWVDPRYRLATIVTYCHDGDRRKEHKANTNREISDKEKHSRSITLQGCRIYALEADRLAAPVSLKPHMELARDGAGLAGVLDRLRDNAPERFESLNNQLADWLPEFDRVLFDTPHEGIRQIGLRVPDTGAVIPAWQLSHGTLLVLGMLTVASLPDPPPIIGLEEPDRGIHPRLLRDVKDALERLAYPDRFGEDREPVQVIATTHSPYFLDLFRDQPECVVIAEKHGIEATFKKLTEIYHWEDILQDSHLGEAWYSGVLGGVPSEQ